MGRTRKGVARWKNYSSLHVRCRILALDEGFKALRPISSQKQTLGKYLRKSCCLFPSALNKLMTEKAT
jgi:hypothetical protein